jgi:hypothetical protein
VQRYCRWFTVLHLGSHFDTTCFGLHGHLRVCMMFYFHIPEGICFAARRRQHNLKTQCTVFRVVTLCDRLLKSAPESSPGTWDTCTTHWAPAKEKEGLYLLDESQLQWQTFLQGPKGKVFKAEAPHNNPCPTCCLLRCGDYLISEIAFSLQPGQSISADFPFPNLSGLMSFHF